MTIEDVAEAPSQTGAEKSGNLGLMDLAAELSLPETEELASEEESLEVSEEVDESGEAPELDESETESEEDDDVLSQGEQEEEPESEEEEPENRGVQKLLKQVSKLTARAKGAEEERDDLKERLGERSNH